MYLSVSDVWEDHHALYVTVDMEYAELFSAQADNFLDFGLGAASEGAALPYLLFRSCAATAQPVPWLVMSEPLALCCDGIVTEELLQSRVQLSAPEEESIAARAVADGEKAARETALQQA